MKRTHMEFHKDWTWGPMTFWVHRKIAGKKAVPVREPKPIPGRGFPHYWVELDGFEFQFSSLDELDVCVDVLSQKALPTTRRLLEIALEAGTPDHWTLGPYKHWLSKLPGWVKEWKYRQKAVKYLAQARKAFESELAVLITKRGTRLPKHAH